MRALEDIFGEKNEVTASGSTEAASTAASTGEAKVEAKEDPAHGKALQGLAP